MSLAWTFLYLLFFRLAAQFGLPSPTPFANAVQLLLTLKVGKRGRRAKGSAAPCGEFHPSAPRGQMVSLANDVHSFHVEKRKEVSCFGGSPAPGGLSREPAFYDLLSYGYCYIGIMTGESGNVRRPAGLRILRR